MTGSRSLTGRARSVLVPGVVFAILLGSAQSPAQSEQAKEQARQHFKRGQAAFELGKFKEALAAYEKAYEVLPLPGFLFNIGQCHRNLKHHEKAIFSFRLYLEKVPRAKNRADVETTIEDLEARAEEERRRSAQEKAARVPEYRPDPDARGDIVKPPPRRPPPPPPRPFYQQWWFWVPVTAVVIAGGAVGTYFAVRPGEPNIPQSSLGVWDLR